METLEAYAPGIGKLRTAFELLTPDDIETRYGMPGGQWHHAELAVEQMLFSQARDRGGAIRTPVAGLWLACAGTHPGGGVSGSPASTRASRRSASGGQHEERASCISARRF